MKKIISLIIILVLSSCSSISQFGAGVDITFDPIWEPKMMTDKGKEMLGFNIKEDKSSNDNWE